MGHIFDPHTLQEIVKKVIGLPNDEMVRKLVDELAAQYPGHIESRGDWIFNIAGGITGIMNILHGSMSEYLLIFGTATGTDGFSGRYLLDIYDVVLSGEMSTYAEDAALTPRIHKPGDLAFLPRGKVKACHFSPDNWMLEYGRGPTATSLPFALMSANDFRIVARTLLVYGKLTIKELLRGKW
jgi:C-8 sterol isomerase